MKVNIGSECSAPESAGGVVESGALTMRGSSGKGGIRSSSVTRCSNPSKPAGRSLSSLTSSMCRTALEAVLATRNLRCERSDDSRAGETRQASPHDLIGFHRSDVPVSEGLEVIVNLQGLSESVQRSVNVCTDRRHADLENVSSFRRRPTVAVNHHHTDALHLRQLRQRWKQLGRERINSRSFRSRKSGPSRRKRRAALWPTR